MSVKKVILASTEFPSGVAWLKNSLLALDICIRPSHKLDYWVNRGDKYQIASSEELRLRQQWFPILKEKEIFDFPEGLQVLWTHEWPKPEHKDFPCIFFARHGKDSLYSDFKRNVRHLEFLDYLKHPSPLGRGSLVSIEYLPPAELWALYSLIWYARAQKNGLVVKFEEAKASPFETLERVLNFLNIQRTPAQIEAAIESSRLDKAQKVETSLETKTNLTIHRRGKVDEWKETYTHEAHQAFQGLPALALKKLGYETTGTGPGTFSKPLVMLARGFIRGRLKNLETVEKKTLNPIDSWHLGKAYSARGKAAKAQVHYVNAFSNIENPTLKEMWFRELFRSFSSRLAVILYLRQCAPHSIRPLAQEIKWKLYKFFWKRSPI